MDPRNIDWYFDFISPFAYLQFKHLDRLPKDVEMRYHPVLFTGLLGHWEHKGPAEIPAKRIQTYRYCDWLSNQLGVPFKMPPHHPFNPLQVLRLAIALGQQHDSIRVIFDYIWGEGGNVHDETGVRELADRLEVDDVVEKLSEPTVKAQLRSNTESAIAQGVYGVPTLIINGELFWGFDLTDMAIAYLNDSGLLETPEMKRLAGLPSAADRLG